MPNIAHLRSEASSRTTARRYHQRGRATHEVPTIILPGFNGSDENHWQTHWQDSTSGAVRFRPKSWTQPTLDDWSSALSRALAETGRAYLVAHSLSCLLVAHWASRSYGLVAGAFLVAVPDPDLPTFPVAARSFAKAPRTPLPFPTLVVASENDPYGSAVFAQNCARRWGADFATVGRLGHINNASDIGPWPHGRALFNKFRAQTSR